MGIVKASLEILGIGIGVKKSGIAHACYVLWDEEQEYGDGINYGDYYQSRKSEVE